MTSGLCFDTLGIGEGPNHGVIIHSSGPGISRHDTVVDFYLAGLGISIPRTGRSEGNHLSSVINHLHSLHLVSLLSNPGVHEAQHNLFLAYLYFPLHMCFYPCLLLSLNGSIHIVAPTCVTATASRILGEGGRGEGDKSRRRRSVRLQSWSLKADPLFVPCLISSRSSVPRQRGELRKMAS